MSDKVQMNGQHKTGEPKVDKEEFYKSLEEKLNNSHVFPCLFMFKFIIPNDLKTLAQVEALFRDDVVMTTRESKTGKYISVTGKEKVADSAEVIRIYREAEKIKGLMSL